MRWLAFVVPWALLAAGCSSDVGGDPWATGPSSMSSSAGDEDTGGGSDSVGDDAAPGEDTTGGEEATGADEAASAGTDTGGQSEVTGADEGTDEGTSTSGDDTTDATSEGPPLECIDLGECQPCVDCTVAPEGPCQDEALACQNDGDCNVLANCYNGCVMQFMGDAQTTCVQGCYDDHPDSVATFQAAYGCFLDVCGELCV